MTDLSDFRAKYPQYNDMSDQQVADKLHASYYSDIPKDQFYKRLGFEPEQSGIRGIGQDIERSVKGLPSAIGNALANLPGQAYESGKQVITHPIRATENIGAGALEGLKGAANIPSNIAAYLKAKDIGTGSIEDTIARAHIDDTGLQQKVLGAPQPGDELLQGLGSFAPYGLIGGAQKGLAGLASRTAANTAYATGQNQNPLTAALMGMAAEGATHGLQKAFKPGRFLPSSPLSNEDLSSAQGITAGTNTDLGNTIQNPQMKRLFENVLPDMPFSGAPAVMQQTAKDVTSRGEGIISDLLGNYEGSDIGQSLQQALKDAAAETRAQKNANFAQLNQAADEAGVSTSRSNLRSSAQEALDKIRRDKDLAAANGPEANKLLEEFAQAGNNDKFSLQDTDMLRGVLRKNEEAAFKSGNDNLSNIYGKLKTASVKDINDAIDNADNKDLNSLRTKAMEFYAKEYAPFKDKDIMKYTREGADSDTLTSAFIKNSRIADRSNLLSKLSTKLSPEDKQLLSYSYFSRAVKDGQLQPQTLKTLYRSLGNRQKQALLTDDMNKRLSDYSSLVQKNIEPLNVMFNPKTGQRNASMLSLLGPLGGAAGALATGNLSAGFLAGVAPSLLSRPLTKALTSEPLRNAVIKRMLAARAKAQLPQRNLAPAANALLQSSQNPMEINVNKYAGQG